MSNTRYHSIGLKVKEKQESNPGRQSDDRMGENSRGKANLKRWVLSFERNVETDNELRVSGGREFQSLGAMTLPGIELTTCSVPSASRYH